MKLTWYLVDYINSLRCAKILSKSCNTKYKYNTSICAIAKNEEPYIKEWLDHHFKIGFEHIYLLDNNDDEIKLELFLSDYNLRNRITIIGFNRIKPSFQSAAYHYCMLNYGFETKWMAFIDIDEFFILKKHDDINIFLKSYNKYPSIIVSWVTFGSNGQVYKKEGGVLERFPLPAREGRKIDSANIAFKSLVQTICYTTHFDCVLYAHRWNFPIFNEHGKRIFGGLTKQSIDYIALNHYYTKSYEEFVSRVKSGDACNNKKTEEDFFSVNPESMRDEILKYKNQRLIKDE